MDKFPNPSLDDFSSNLHNKRVLSKIGPVGVYNQTPIDIPMIVVATAHSLFDVHRMPFGIRSATQDATFQKFINEASILTSLISMTWEWQTRVGCSTTTVLKPFSNAYLTTGL